MIRLALRDPDSAKLSRLLSPSPESASARLIVKISCPACQAKYSIADEKVTDRLAKIRCRKCGATIVIDGKTSPANVYTAAGEAPDATGAVEQDASASQYSVDFGEGDQRSLSVSEIVVAYNAGQVTAETYVWADGFADWKALGEVEEVVEALHAATQAAAPAPTATPSPWSAPAAAPRAAARPARGAAADLFGGIEQAGSEEEVLTSAPEHATGGGAHAAPAVGGGASSTGARNESSVLFSLSALTSASSPVAATRPASRPITSSTARDDSGLIDLKALTAAATKNESAPMAAMAAPIGVAPPLGIAPPLGLASPLGGGFSASSQPSGYPSAGGKSKAPLFIGGGVVLAALIVAGAIVLKPQPPPPAPAPVAVVAPPAAAPTPAPTPVITATPPSTGTATEEPAPSTKPATGATPKRVYTGPAVGAKKPAAAEPPAAGPAAAPKPKRSACGCAPNDLMCNMSCSAK